MISDKDAISDKTSQKEERKGTKHRERKKSRREERLEKESYGESSNTRQPPSNVYGAACAVRNWTLGVFLDGKRMVRSYCYLGTDNQLTLMSIQLYIQQLCIVAQIQCDLWIVRNLNTVSIDTSIFFHFQPKSA